MTEQPVQASPEVAWAEARSRYWTDAEFHARVSRAINIAAIAGYDIEDKGSRAMLCHTLALVLHVEDADRG